MKKKKRRVPTSSRNKKEALIFLNNFNVSLKSISFKQTISLINFKNEYVKFIGLTYSKKYLSSIKLSFRQLLKYTQDIPLKKISIRVVQEFLSKTYKRTQKGAELYLRTLKATFNRAVDCGYLKDNPFKKVKLPKSQKSYPIFINESELDIILNHTSNEELKLLFILGFNTGIRLGELTNLKWENIDLMSKTIAQKKDISFSTKNRMDRIIPMNDKVTNLFQKKIASHEVDLYVFVKGGAIKFNNDYVSKSFKKAVRRAKLNDKIHFHTLKHSFASRLIQRGASIYIVKELLGHSDVTTTQILSHLEQSNLRDVMNVF